MGRVTTPSSRRLARMPGNSANASSRIMFSTEPRLDPDIALPLQAVCWALSRSVWRGEGLIDRSLALRVWPLHVFGCSLFTSATSRQWNFGSPVFIWKHPCTVPCISKTLWGFCTLTEVFLNLTEVFLTLTEVFPCFFLSCKANARVKLAKTGHGPHSSTLVVICVVRLLFALFYVLFVCKCVLPPGDNPIALNKYIILTLRVLMSYIYIWSTYSWCF